MHTSMVVKIQYHNTIYHSLYICPCSVDPIGEVDKTLRDQLSTVT